MKKIPTLFQRTEDRRHVTREVTAGCEWVLRGEGQATRKYDGSCVRIDHGWHDGPQLFVWARREVKAGKEMPSGFVLAETDQTTGKSFGWEPYGRSGFAKYVDEALGIGDDGWADPNDWPVGTYELCGPKINGNPEGFDSHRLIRHGEDHLSPPITFAGLQDWLSRSTIEGLVWHHPDGRMAKLKRRDFPPNVDGPPR